MNQPRALVFAAAPPTAGAETPPLSVEDRIAIGDTIASLGLLADQHEWARVEALFAPEVTTDYVSLFGGTPQVQSPTLLVHAWRALLPGFDATQHLITPIEIVLTNSDKATARSNVRATHRFASALWVVGGLYTHELVRGAEGWRIASLRFALAYEEGDRDLALRAADRAKGQSNASRHGTPTPH